MNNSSHVSRTIRGVQGAGAQRGAKRTTMTRGKRGRRVHPREDLTAGGPSLDLCQVNVVHLGAVRAALASLPGDGGLHRVSELLALLSNATRLKLLLALRPAAPDRASELCVCDLAVVSGASKSMTSHQLRLLRTAGIVRQRRVGKLAFYRLAQGPLVTLLASIAGIAADERPDVALREAR